MTQMNKPKVTKQMWEDVLFSCGVSQKALAEKWGVSTATISNIKARRYDPFFNHPLTFAEKAASRIMALYETRQHQGYDAPAFEEVVHIIETGESIRKTAKAGAVPETTGNSDSEKTKKHLGEAS